MVNKCTTDGALVEELHEIERRRFDAGVTSTPPRTAKPDDVLDHATALDLTALCLSGGGIRSAAFCLGVIQALAKAKLLNQFDYVSSVSGGGYISGWLQMLLRDRCMPGGGKSVDDVLDELGNGTLAALRRLRGFTSFLTPEPGLASADAWAGITLYLRNLILNWLVFLPALLLAALVPQFYRTCVRSFVDVAPKSSLCLLLWPLGFGLACLVFATARACVLLPSHRVRTRFKSARQIGCQVVTPVILWAYTVPFVVDYVYYSVHQASLTLANFELYSPGNAYNVWLDAQKLIIPGLYIAALLAGYGLAWISKPAAGLDRSLYRANAMRWTAATLLSAFLMWLGLVLASTDNPLYRLATATWGNIHVLIDSETALTIFAPLLLIVMHLLQTTFYVAFRHRGRFAELDREWLGRLNGLVLRIALGLAIISFCGLVLPLWLGLNGGTAIWQHRNLSGTAGSAAALAAIAAWLGKFFKAQIEEVANHTGTWRAWIASSLVLNALCIASAILLFAFAGGLLQQMLGLLQDSINTMADTAEPLRPSFAARLTLEQLANRHVTLDCARVLADPHALLPIAKQPCDVPTWLQSIADQLRDTGSLSIFQKSSHEFALPLLLEGLTGPLFFVCTVWFGRINVNRFSMHAVYRNRLVRAFLGTARRRRKRRPDPFTGFDLTADDNTPTAAPARHHDDNPRLTSFGKPTPKQQRLFPVINMTLNITVSNNTAWAERKAASFIATPLHCGSDVLHHQIRRTTNRRPKGVFVPTSGYAGKDSLDDGPAANDGVTFGTMMTISGAAISPSWGYHSSPATAFAMTLFNVRLGAWLPNPAVATDDQLQLAKPRNSLLALGSELIGQTRDDSQAIYLSDGGHFENLAMYEMLRRRCRYLVVVDAGQDQDCALFDLGNAIRKAAIDFNIHVNMHRMRIYPRKDVDADKPASGNALGFATGKIHYPDGRLGRLIYLKPSWLPNIPTDVRAFGLSNPSFPHVSTVDQWFTESEFESYRALGEWQMQQLTAQRPSTLAALFRAADTIAA